MKNSLIIKKMNKIPIAPFEPNAIYIIVEDFNDDVCQFYTSSNDGKKIFKNVNINSENDTDFLAYYILSKG